MTESNAAIYDRAREDWVRHSPVVVSDFTARPALFKACEPVAGTRVLDLSRPSSVACSRRCTTTSSHARTGQPQRNDSAE